MSQSMNPFLMLSIILDRIERTPDSMRFVTVMLVAFMVFIAVLIVAIATNMHWW